ncbi:MAG: hypothetical protein ACOXZV_10460 [Bacteroidales bacterium]|jgi:hypothetical protein
MTAFCWQLLPTTETSIYDNKILDEMEEQMLLLKRLCRDAVVWAGYVNTVFPSPRRHVISFIEGFTLFEKGELAGIL